MRGAVAGQRISDVAKAGGPGSPRPIRGLSRREALILLGAGALAAEQALINVLINSIEAVGKGGMIEIKTEILGGKSRSLIVEISDDGKGIVPEDLPYVFDPFFSSKKKGTGLGLATVKKIIEAHGGRVDAGPREPKGTHLRLIFPVKEGS